MARRQSEDIRATFGGGIEASLVALEQHGLQAGDFAPDQARAPTIEVLVQAAGALVMSRAWPDDAPLADEILEVGKRRILAVLDQPAAL